MAARHGALTYLVVLAFIFYLPGSRAEPNRERLYQDPQADLDNCTRAACLSEDGLHDCPRTCGVRPRSLHPGRSQLEEGEKCRDHVSSDFCNCTDPFAPILCPQNCSKCDLLADSRKQWDAVCFGDRNELSLCTKLRYSAGSDHKEALCRLSHAQALCPRTCGQCFLDQLTQESCQERRCENDIFDLILCPETCNVEKKIENTTGLCSGNTEEMKACADATRHCNRTLVQKLCPRSCGNCSSQSPSASPATQPAMIMPSSTPSQSSTPHPYCKDVDGCSLRNIDCSTIFQLLECPQRCNICGKYSDTVCLKPEQEKPQCTKSKTLCHIDHARYVCPVTCDLCPPTTTLPTETTTNQAASGSESSPTPTTESTATPSKAASQTEPTTFADTSTTSTASPTIPATSPTIPATSPTIPATSPTTPSTTPTTPTTTPTTPTTTPTTPTTTPTTPTTTPTTPTTTPTTPTTTPITPSSITEISISPSTSEGVTHKQTASTQASTDETSTGDTPSGNTMTSTGAPTSSPASTDTGITSSAIFTNTAAPALSSSTSQTAPGSESSLSSTVPASATGSTVPTATVTSSGATNATASSASVSSTVAMNASTATVPSATETSPPATSSNISSTSSSGTSSAGVGETSTTLVTTEASTAPTTTPTTVTTTTTAPTTQSTFKIIKTTTPHVSVVKRSCFQCGDAASRTPCNPMELALGQPSQCPPGLAFCQTDIIQEFGTRVITKRCVDRNTCEREWYRQTSDVNECTFFDPTSLDFDLQCHFCCAQNDCNQGLKPDENVLFIPS